jgi:hypothetical protein
MNWPTQIAIKLERSNPNNAADLSWPLIISANARWEKLAEATPWLGAVAEAQSITIVRRQDGARSPLAASGPIGPGGCPDHEVARIHAVGASSKDAGRPFWCTRFREQKKRIARMACVTRWEVESTSGSSRRIVRYRGSAGLGPFRPAVSRSVRRFRVPVWGLAEPFSCSPGHKCPKPTSPGGRAGDCCRPVHQVLRRPDGQGVEPDRRFRDEAGVDVSSLVLDARGTDQGQARPVRRRPVAWPVSHRPRRRCDAVPLVHQGKRVA